MFKNTQSKQEKGQGLVEYALIIVLIAIVVIVAMQYLAPTIGGVFSDIGDTLSVASGGGGGEEWDGEGFGYDYSRLISVDGEETDTEMCESMGETYTWGSGWDGEGCYFD